MEFVEQGPYTQVIVPARNEQDCIGRCIESLLQQRGIRLQLTVVDDGSTDRTREIAQSFAGVSVIAASEIFDGSTGKCNALICGTRGAQAQWLLFTDADTYHYPGSLAVAVREAEQRGVDLLSYSPEQEVAGWSELALMPVVFAELVRAYPPRRVNDPGDPVAAANGQYILVRRDVYEKLGGHRAVADKLLEDVELARLFKAAGRKIWFRYGSGMVRTRMYRSYSAMAEGWTKNLSLLFPGGILLAVFRLAEFLAITGGFTAAALLLARHHLTAGLAALVIGAITYIRFLLRIREAHFPWKARLMAVFGLPLFAGLLWRSYIHAKVRGVMWKGRIYRHSETGGRAASSIKEGVSG
jgi:glycosyltransferase involved in cell wall biosynthesis